MKIGYFTDLHFREAIPGTSECPARRCRKVKKTLNQCLKKFNKKKVDLIICTGDLLDTPNHSKSAKDLQTLQNMLEKISIPKIIIPGNHDSKYKLFYNLIDKPKKIKKIKDCEFIAFFKDYLKNESVRRPKNSIERMRKFLKDNPSGINYTFCLQHYLIHPYLKEEYPYNYKNYSLLRNIMESSPRNIVSLSGHYHPGVYTKYKNVNYISGKAMCEHPFPYFIIDVNKDGIIIKEFEFKGSCIMKWKYC